MMIPELSKSKRLSVPNLPKTIPGKTSKIVELCKPPSMGLQAPILGKHGSFYSSKIKKVIPKKPVKSFGISQEPKPLHMSPLVYPPKYDGYYNVMWDPRVRRGTSLIHFSDLENLSCDNRRKKIDKPKVKEEKNPLFTGSGQSKINYPHVQLPHKTELLDYSMFLEEEMVENLSKFIDTDTQTEYRDNENQQQHDRADSKHKENDSKYPSHNSKPDPTEVVNAWRSGIEIGTQVDSFQISKEIRADKPNPRQLTINRVSDIMTAQIMHQSALETQQCEELERIRGQCESITQWMVQDQMRKFEEHRQLCKRIHQEKLEEEFDAFEEGEMKKAEAQVKVNLFAQNYIRTLFERSFGDFQKAGIVGNKETKSSTKPEGSLGPQTVEPKAAKAWIDDNVEIYYKNMNLDRSIVDDLILDASMKRYEDHKAFLERFGISSSLNVEPRTSEESDGLDSNDPSMTEVAKDDDDADDGNDEGYLNEDNDDSRDSGNKDDDDSPGVIKLMENNPKFKYKEDEKD